MKKFGITRLVMMRLYFPEIRKEAEVLIISYLGNYVKFKQNKIKNKYVYTTS